MTTLRSILDDLVEKKLWPIALALVVALVALPLAFGGGGSEEPPAPRSATPAGAAGDPAGATATASAVRLAAGDAVDKRTRKGAVRDPFKQLAKAKPSTTDSAAGAGGSATTTSPGTVTGGTTLPGAATSPGSAGTTAPSATTPQGKRVKVDEDVRKAAEDGRITDKEIRDGFGDGARHDVGLRFGKRGGKLKSFSDPKLLAAFPNRALPLVVLNYVRDDGKAVRFLVNALARVERGGRCYPSRDACRVLDLRQGSRAIVQVAVSPTEVEEYRLEVARIGKTG